jgi:VIT1/CCC1 family predicted Fe2+/Mn2+ transporter
MPKKKHNEPHFTAPEFVHDIVIGMSDGLTVPFAIAAGMSGANVSANIVVIAGLAEIAAGSISMGLGGYLSGNSDMEHYNSEFEREVMETEKFPELETKEVSDILVDWGLSHEDAQPVVETLKQDRDRWVDFMMRFELGLERPASTRAIQSALTIGLSYAVSGFIPLAPYIILPKVSLALLVSAAVTLAALFIFGVIKGRALGVNPLRSGLQTVLIGGLAAGAAFAIARLIGG